jgi:hypothetical protein
VRIDTIQRGGRIPAVCITSLIVRNSGSFRPGCSNTTPRRSADATSRWLAPRSSRSLSEIVVEVHEATRRSRAGKHIDERRAEDRVVTPVLDLRLPVVGLDPNQIVIGVHV